MAELKGIYAVNITPFKADGSIDYDMSKKHINWLIESGVHGLLPLGATGEFASLTFEERTAYAEFVMKEVDDRVPVIIGAVSQNIEVSLALLKHAIYVGAAGVMVLPSPGLHLNQDEIYAFYEYLSDNADIPIMLYNNPGSAGVNIEPDNMARIAKLTNVKLLKESTGDISRLTRAVDELEKELIIFCGCENLAYESFVMGAKAWVCVISNIAPAMAVELYDLIVNKGDLVKAREVNCKLLPYLRLLEESGELWQIIKYTLEKQGMGTSALRRPRMPISAESKKKTDELLAKYSYK